VACGKIHIALSGCDQVAGGEAAALKVDLKMEGGLLSNSTTTAQTQAFPPLSPITNKQMQPSFSMQGRWESRMLLRLEREMSLKDAC
jgi:hypothetical protein